MSLGFLSDENFNNILVRRLLRHYHQQQTQQLDLVRVQDVGLLHADDATVLEWAANAGRILLTHDVRTIPDYAYARVSNGQSMPGVIVIVEKDVLTNATFESLLIIIECSQAEEWEGRVAHLPLM